ncbi:MAG: hypothetical protein ACREJD_04660 [Phycisphaerales bacterium]
MITESPTGIRFANIGEIFGLNDNTGSWCPTELDVSNVLEISGPDYAKDSSGANLWQAKCTINVSRVANISTVSDSTHAGNAVIDVRSWKKGYTDDDLDLDVEVVSIAGTLTGRVYGGPQDNVSEYLSGGSRAHMRETHIGAISAGGVIGLGTTAPRDPTYTQGHSLSLEVGQSTFAFLVEAATIDSISGDTVYAVADTTVVQDTSADRRVTQIIATGTRTNTSGQEDVAGIHGKILADTIAPTSGLNALISCDGDLSATIKLGDRSGATVGLLAGNASDGSPSVIVGRTLRSGAILQTIAAGLQGQVIINNKSVPGSWTGDVKVGTTTITHGSDGTYSSASSFFGDGAVGLVPFRIYEADCAPLSVTPASGPLNVVLDSDLRGTKVGTPQHIKLAFYGPVVSSDSTRAPFNIGIAQNPPSGHFYDLTGNFVVTVKGLGTNSTISRVIDITGKPDGHYPPGIYAVRQATGTGGSAGSRLLCDVPGTPEVPSFTYWFEVKKDCNDDGTPDNEQLSDISPVTGLMYDQNGNGVIDDCEPLLPCTADFNADHVVDDDDFVIFAAAYNLLLCSDVAMPIGCPADLNLDGNVEDSDFVIFAAQYDQLLCP